MQVQQQFYLSPIANPLCNDTLRSKLLKLCHYFNRDKRLRRGVKDVVKAIKKSSKGICVLAADVTPPDVISHLPILCEDNGIPYIFVRSRRELGISSETKKPTSVVLILEPPKDHQLADKFAKLHQKIKDNHPFM